MDSLAQNGMQSLRDLPLGMGLSLDDRSITKLDTYCQLLLQWGNSINLVSKNDLNLDRLKQRHLYDCLAVQKTPLFSKAKVWLDLGSGAGLPSLILAICQPSCHITSLDSSHKKTTFQREVARILALDNINIVCENAHQLASQASWQHSFDGIICRAFADLTTQLVLASAFLKPNGMLFSMQGDRYCLKRLRPLDYGLHLHKPIYQYPATSPSISKQSNNSNQNDLAFVLVFTRHPDNKI